MEKSEHDHKFAPDNNSEVKVLTLEMTLEFLTLLAVTNF